jgi:hypothetical protein
MVLRETPRITVVRFDRDASALPPSRFIQGQTRIFAPMFGLETWPRMSVATQVTGGRRARDKEAPIGPGRG